MVRLGGQLSIIPLWSVIPNNRHFNSWLKAEGEQTKGQVFDIQIVVLPSVRLPDTIVLVSHGLTMIAIFFIVIFEYLGPRITFFFVDSFHHTKHEGNPVCGVKG